MDVSSIHFISPLQPLAVAVSLFSSGAILFGFLVFFYISLRWRKQVYAAMAAMIFSALVFCAAGAATLVAGGYYFDASLGRQFHRIEQIGATLFLFSLPYFLQTFLVDESWRKVSRLFMWAGAAVTTIIITGALFAPDTFISQTIPQSDWMRMQSSFGRGAQGKLYTVRDIFLAAMLLLTFIALFVDVFKQKNKLHVVPIVAGILIAGFAAIDDTFYVHWFRHIGPFGEIEFSRFSAGIAIFAFLSSAGVLAQFVDHARDVEISMKSWRESEERFHQIADNIGEVFWLVDLKDSRLLFLNGAYEKVWKRKRDPLYESLDTWFESIAEEDRDKVRKQALSAPSREAGELLYRINVPGRGVRWIREHVMPIFNEWGDMVRLARISSDVTERKKAEERLHRLAYHDQLTGLYNRKAFKDRLTESLAQADRTTDESERFRALLFIDLDRFKEVNDIAGHEAGDTVLCGAAERLKACLRSSDIICRPGDDEFLIMLTGLSAETSAVYAAEKIREAMNLPIIVGERTFYCGASIGIAVYPDDAKDANNLMRCADIALVEAKKTRGIYTFFHPDMQQKAEEKVRINAGLRKALERNELRLHYQPLISRTGKITGVEALMRWRSSEEGDIPPGKFIPIAEETGLITQMGRWALDEACRQSREWKDAGISGFPISVNLSVKQFKDKDLVAAVHNAMQKYSIGPESIKLEITESSLAENFKDAKEKLDAIQELGVHFSLDDFGTGYSSLSYLKRFPISSLKIDRSFVMGLPGSRHDAALVKAIISMAHEFGMEVVAEGVETAEQLGFLQKLYCNTIQGYYYSPPLPAEKFAEFFVNRGS